MVDLQAAREEMPKAFLDGNILKMKHLSALLNHLRADCLQKGLTFSPLPGRTEWTRPFWLEVCCSAFASATRELSFLADAAPSPVDCLSVSSLADPTVLRTENPQYQPWQGWRVTRSERLPCGVECRARCDPRGSIQRPFPFGSYGEGDDWRPKL